MINREELLEFAREFQLEPNVVEKDYALGWLLAGIGNHPDLRDAWVFKGGTCLKKCFFETYRFSEDLDLLDWIGKDAVVKHHKDVPYRLLEPVAELSCGDTASGNLIVQGDNQWTATEDDRLIGGLWEELSDGRCRFVMTTEKDWSRIDAKL